MKKVHILLVMWALYVPFSHSSDHDPNDIFQNGTIGTNLPEMSSHIECKMHGGDVIGSAKGADFGACMGVFNNHFNTAYQDKKASFHQVCSANDPYWRSHNELYVEYKVATREGTACNVWKSFSMKFQTGDVFDLKKCPPKDSPDQTAPWYHPDRDPEVIDKCFDPDQADLLDSCKGSSGNAILNAVVGAQSGCHRLSDGSICKYDAVSVGGGKQVYQMDYEGSCYREGAPDMMNLTNMGDLPTNACTNYGGLLACPEDPQNVCSQTSSSIGGGTINSCQTGCGYVNNQFICYDVDTDSDGLPDYNDPDIDGDGIPNNDDLDSDGDGQDDPIHGGNNGTGGGTTVNVDTSGLEEKLDKLTEANTIPDGSEITDLITQKQEQQDAAVSELFESENMEKLNNYATNQGMFSDFSAISAAMTGAACNNPTHSQLGQFNICSKISEVRPYLYILFGFLTFMYCMWRFSYFVTRN